MSREIPINAWMNFPAHRENRIIDGILKRSNKNWNRAYGSRGGIYWDARSLGIDRVQSYRLARPEIQEAILRDCSYSLLREAFAIERAGMAFAAKMILLSDDLESRVLYSQFAAQEAAHYQAVAAYISHEPKDLEQDAFLAVLKNAIENGGRMSLTLLVQVFLEGWGLLHYKKLAKDCLDLSLAEELRQILQDEAHHHGSGVALLDLNKMSAQEHDLSIETLRVLLEMVAAGPWALATILAKHLTPGESPLRFYPELNHQEETSLKLLQLKRILEVGGAKELVAILERDHLFALANSETRN